MCFICLKIGRKKMRLIDADKLENDIVENITVKAVSRMLAITQGQPTVKAIPIEYIKAFKEEVRDVTNGKAVIEWLLENWEKDNE